MIKFSRILCPIDFSDIATRALIHATALAEWYKATLTVLHIVPVFEENMVSGFPLLDDEHRTPYAPRRADVLADMRSAIERTGASARAPTLLAEEGRTHRVIVERAAAMQSNLLVLGTHGRSGFNRLFLALSPRRSSGRRRAPC